MPGKWVRKRVTHCQQCPHCILEEGQSVVGQWTASHLCGHRSVRDMTNGEPMFINARDDDELSSEIPHWCPLDDATQPESNFYGKCPLCREQTRLPNYMLDALNDADAINGVTVQCPHCADLYSYSIRNYDNVVTSRD